MVRLCSSLPSVQESLLGVRTLPVEAARFLIVSGICILVVVFFGTCLFSCSSLSVRLLFLTGRVSTDPPSTLAVPKGLIDVVGDNKLLPDTLSVLPNSLALESCG